MLLCTTLSFALEWHNIMGSSFCNNIESSSYNGADVSGNFGSVGFYVADGLYPTDSHIGFLISGQLNVFPNGMLAKTGQPYGLFDSFAWNGKFLLAPAIKNTGNGYSDTIIFQFAPGIILQSEFEKGKVGTTKNYKSYTYYAFLFGLGCDVHLIIPSSSKVGFGIGFTFAYCPFYNPNVEVSYGNKSEKFDIDFDSYKRFQFGIIIGIGLNRK